jgi:hypothetical protein
MPTCVWASNATTPQSGEAGRYGHDRPGDDGPGTGYERIWGAEQERNSVEHRDHDIRSHWDIGQGWVDGFPAQPRNPLNLRPRNAIAGPIEKA